MASKKHNLSDIKLAMSLWPDIPAEAVPEGKRNLFERRKKAITMYADGCNVADIHNMTGVRCSHISEILDRCLQYDQDGKQFGYSALIPNFRTTSNDDKKENGLFGKLIARYPSLKEYIRGCWNGDRKYTGEYHMNLTTLHKDYFLKECERLGIQDYEYPFNTSTKGYYALIEYIKTLQRENAAERAKRSSRDEKQKLLSTGIDKRITKPSLIPFSEVQIDGHKIDLLYTVEFTESDGTVSRTIANRMWFFPVIDTATRCVIGYSVSQESNYNQYDVLRAVKNAILPHEKMEFTVPGLEYPENIGFPSNVLSETKYACFDRIMLDNAKSHLATHVIDRLTRTLNCVMDFGSVATPETRGIVERFFGSLETKGFHKLSMTTGSSINDLKRKDAEKKALKSGLTFELICELLEVLIARYNNTPHSGINNKTPLECMTRRIREAGLYPSIADETVIADVQKLENRFEERIVRGGKNGKRAYISYAGAEYRCNELSIGDKYIGHRITLEINPSDISTIEAYDSNGTYIGILKARGEYGTKSHSLKTRKQALQYARDRGRKNAEFDTPITAFTQHLDEQAKNSKRAATRGDIVRRELGDPKPSTRPKNKYNIQPLEIGRTLSDTADYSRMPSAEELAHMTEKDLIDRLYRKVK